MTTVVDPLGSPTLIFNRSGTSIVSLTGGATAGASGASGIGDDANPIPRVSETTVAIVTCTLGPTRNILVRLPDDAEVGDVVEVHAAPAAQDSPIVFPNVGEAIGQRAASTGTNNAAGSPVDIAQGGASFRKVSSTQWMPVGAA